MIKKHFPLFLFIMCYVLFALLTYKDYGLTYDEEVMYKDGAILYNYLFSKPTEYERDLLLTKRPPPQAHYLYSHIYGALLYALNPNGSYEFYHLLNILFSIPLFIFAYIILFKFYKNQYFAILGPILFFLFPRLLGDIPTNTKDVSFAVFYFVSLSAIYIMSVKRSFWKIIILGLLFGISQSLRIVGLNLYFIMFIYDLYLHKKNFRKKSIFYFLLTEIVLIVTVFTIAGLFTYLTWPYLARNFIVNFWAIIISANKFLFSTTVLTLGQNFTSTQLPWFYIPIWTLVTFPLFILFFLFHSLIFVKKPFGNNLFFLFFSAVLINSILLIIFKPVIYDALRHLLYLQVVLVFIAIISIIEFMLYRRKLWLNKLILALTVINIIFLVKDIIILHPYEYIYFNNSTRGIRGAFMNFETDYFGASYQEGVNWLIKNKIKQDKVYYIYTCGLPLSSTAFFLANMEWTSDLSKVNYILCFTRWNQHLQFDQTKIIHTVSRFGVPLIFIYEYK